MRTEVPDATGLALLDPWMLLVLLLVPAALWWRRWRGEPALIEAGLSDAATRAAIVDSHALPRWRALVAPGLQVAGLCLLALALARPAQRTPIRSETPGLDILLAIDTSSSMTTPDPVAGMARIAATKDAAARFVQARNSDRVGLLTFARYPDVRVPLTSDHEALVRMLAGIETVAREGPEDLTGIGGAVARGAQVLGNGSSPGKVLVLLTDGEENIATRAAPEEISPVSAAQLARELGVRVHAILAGGQRDASPASDALAAIAEETEGSFHLAGDALALERIWAEIDALETAPAPNPAFRIEDRFHSFLAGGALLVLLAALLSRSRWGVQP